MSVSKLRVVALFVWYLHSTGRWVLSRTLPTPDSSGKWMLFSELGGSSLQHSSERHLSSAVPSVPAPGVEEVDTASLCLQSMGGAHQASLIVL